jgi:exopolysaccharide biosynthesis polyprenyl glycosylphosphotransferase
MAKQLRANPALLRLVSDIALTELGLFVADSLTPLLPFFGSLGARQTPLNPLIYLLVAFLWAIAFLLLPVYVPNDRRAIDDLQAIVTAVTLATLVLAGTLFFFYPQVSRLQILTFYGLNLVLLIGSRLVVRLGLKLSGRLRYAPRKVLILGAGKEGCDVGRRIAGHQWAEFELIGYLDDDLEPQSIIEGYPVLGKMEELDQWVRSLGIDEVIVAIPFHAYDRFFCLMGELQDLPAKVRMVPDHIKTALFRTRVTEVAGVPMITVQKPALTPFERQIKRIFDLIVAGITLVLISPVLIMVAVAIHVDTPGPILFKQQRIGENGQLFWMYKFRSMVQDAEEQLAHGFRSTEHGLVLFKYPDDPRVTRVGKFIRRTSLDEFPQILNVFRGEMSLVGPRPELPWVTQKYEPWQWQRLSVPQGITGWWQVNGRSDKPMHIHTEEDLFYIQNYSFLLDIQILWRTVGAVINGKGAF